MFKGPWFRVPGKTIHKLVHQFPKLDLSAYVQPITRSFADDPRVCSFGCLRGDIDRAPLKGYRYGYRCRGRCGSR